MSGPPFWGRVLDDEAVVLVFSAEQALALVDELDGLRDVGRCRPRIDELCHRLTFDAAHLASRTGAKDSNRTRARGPGEGENE